MSGKEAEAKTKSPHGKTSRWMVVALLVAAAAFVFRVIAPQTVGEQVRRHLEQTFRDHYPNLEISVGRGHYDPKRGLVFFRHPRFGPGRHRLVNGARGGFDRRALGACV